MKVRFITSLCGLNENYQPNDKVEIQDDEAVRLIQSNIAVPFGKTDEAKYQKILEKETQAKEELVKKQRQAEAILYRDELIAEKDKLQTRIDEIDSILGKEEK